MMRRCVLILSLFAAAALGWAGGDAPRPEEDRLAQFRRDLELIEAFVDKSLVLAEEDDPLQRATTCKGLADKLGQQIRKAEKRTSRMMVLGDMLKTVLIRGVADNLERARGDRPAKDLSKFGDKVSEMTETVEGYLKKALDGMPDEKARKSMAPALHALTRAREDIASAIKGAKRHYEMDKGKGKGKGRFKFKF